MSLSATTGSSLRSAGRSIDGFTEAAGRASGLALSELAAFDCLDIDTMNSRYRLTVLDPAAGRALIEGGSIFSLPVEVTVAGATLGGSLLKIGSVLTGFRLEVVHGGTRVVTSRVRQIRLNDASGLPGPF